MQFVTPKFPDFFLNIQFTQDCFLNCGMCLNPKTIRGHINVDLLIDLMHRVKGSYINGISFGGGEPLLYSDLLYKSIKASYDLNFFTSLATNGLLIDKYFIENVSPYLDLVQLPLDGSNENIVYRMRGTKEIFHKTLQNIQDLNASSKFKGSIKIGTVISCLNNKDVQNIGTLFLINNLIINYWRVFQFRSQGFGAINRDKYWISDIDFTDVVTTLIKYVFPFKFLPCSEHNYHPNLYIMPDGHIYWGHNNPTQFTLKTFDVNKFYYLYLDRIEQLKKYNATLF